MIECIKDRYHRIGREMRCSINQTLNDFEMDLFSIKYTVFYKVYCMKYIINIQNQPRMEYEVDPHISVKAGHVVLLEGCVDDRPRTP